MAQSRSARRTWWLIAVGLLAVALAGVGVVAIAYLTRDDPDPKSVSEAIEELGATSVPGDDDDSASRRPPAGVYVAEGEGRESISFPPASQDDGATMPVSVAHLADGCWSFKIDYNEAHWQDWELCPDGGDLVETGGRTWQSWDLGVTSVENLTVFVCEPAVPFAPDDATAGQAFDRSCEGTSEQVTGTTASDGTMTALGIETLTIDGTAIDAVHLRTENVFSGAQSGRERSEFWLAIADWMPLRGEREISIESDSPVGAITYEEAGHWQLASTEPATATSDS